MLPSWVPPRAKALRECHSEKDFHPPPPLKRGRWPSPRGRRGRETTVSLRPSHVSRPLRHSQSLVTPPPLERGRREILVRMTFAQGSDGWWHPNLSWRELRLPRRACALR